MHSRVYGSRLKLATKNSMAQFHCDKGGFFVLFDKYFSFYLLVRRERSFQSTYFRVTSLEQLSSYLLVREHSFQSTYFRVTSLEQLSLAEFTGGTARPKVYENNHMF